MLLCPCSDLCRTTHPCVDADIAIVCCPAALLQCPWCRQEIKDAFKVEAA